MSIKAYSYARFSSKAQAEGDSLRRQLSAAFDYADEHGLDLDTSLQDKGVSAFTGDNRTKGALKSFLDRVERGEIERGSYLLIDSMDRLSREMVTAATHQLLGIALAGITVVTLSDKRKFDRNASMADVMMAVVEIERAHRESAERGRKVRLSHEESKRRAREEGHRWHASCPAWLEAEVRGTKRNKVINYHVIEERAAVVRRVFDLMESGLGTLAIAQRFNEEPVPTFKGNASWDHSRILTIARSRSVFGEYQPKTAINGVRGGLRPNDGDAVEGYYPKIVEKDQFLRVQELIDQRNHKKGRKNGPKAFTNLFIGMTRCAECGGVVGIHVVGAESKDGWKRTSVLRCGNASRHAPGPIRPDRPCTNKKRHRYPILEAAILAHVKDFTVPANQPRTDKAQVALDAAMAERDDLNQKIETLLDMLESGDQRMRSRYEQRVSELAEKDAEIRRLQNAVGQAAARLPLGTRQKQLESLIAKLGTVEGVELYDLRAAINVALAAVVDQIDFEPNGDVKVITGAGSRAYRFRDGAYLDARDLVPLLDDQMRRGLTSHDDRAAKRLSRVEAAE